MPTKMAVEGITLKATELTAASCWLCSLDNDVTVVSVEPSSCCDTNTGSIWLCELSFGLPVCVCVCVCVSSVCVYARACARARV